MIKYVRFWSHSFLNVFAKKLEQEASEVSLKTAKKHPQSLPNTFSETVKKRTPWLTAIWPHDTPKTVSKSGPKLIKYYSQKDLQCDACFTNLYCFSGPLGVQQYTFPGQTNHHFQVRFWNPFWGGFGTLQVPLGNLPEPLMIVLVASKTPKILFLYKKIHTFQNVVFRYLEALWCPSWVHPYASWADRGPNLAPEII